MVKKIIKNNKIYFSCSECGLVYKKQIIAKECQDWCKKTKSCNLNIIKYAIKGKLYE